MLLFDVPMKLFPFRLKPLFDSLASLGGEFLRWLMILALMGRIS